RECVTRKSDLLSMKRSYAAENLTTLHRMLGIGDFTEIEFYALIAIAFCDIELLEERAEDIELFNSIGETHDPLSR
ncbi:hypothetical protein PENTCL1PPCAC_17233, partial [Pristionchus entomophagus]